MRTVSGIHLTQRLTIPRQAMRSLSRIPQLGACWGAVAEEVMCGHLVREQLHRNLESKISTSVSSHIQSSFALSTRAFYIALVPAPIVSPPYPCADSRCPLQGRGGGLRCKGWVGSRRPQVLQSFGCWRTPQQFSPRPHCMQATTITEIS